MIHAPAGGLVAPIFTLIDAHRPFVRVEAQVRLVHAAAGRRGLPVVDELGLLVLADRSVERTLRRLPRRAGGAGLRGIVVADHQHFVEHVCGYAEGAEAIRAAGLLVVDARAHGFRVRAEALGGPMGELAEASLRNLCEQEKVGIDARARAAAAEMLRSGRWFGDRERPPLGYQVAADGRLRPHPLSGPVVGELFERAAAGTAVADLALWLDASLADLGLAPARRTTTARVCQLLERRVYLGELHWGELCERGAHSPLTTPQRFASAATVARV